MTLKRTGFLARKTPLTNHSSLLRSPLRRSPLARGVSAAPVAGTPRPPEIAPKKRPGGLKPIPLAVREAVKLRAQGLCELCGWRGAVVHHRKLRSQGGGHTVDNCCYLDEQCHRGIHANVAWSYANGWLVRSTDDPAKVAFQPRPADRPWRFE